MENILPNLKELTPVEYKNSYYFKRDDYFNFEDAGCGGKVRTCISIIKKNLNNIKGLSTAGSRSSPQVHIVSSISKYLKIPCRVHVPCGVLGPEVEAAKKNNAIIIQQKPGYNNVLISRCKKDCIETGFLEIPFGMECEEAIEQTSYQVQNIPYTINRIIVPIGSGMSISGILYGIKKYKKDVKVIGIQVGADPIKRLNKYAPKDWKNILTIIKSEYKYDKKPKNCKFCNIDLDPIYEAKCIEYLEKNDLLWIVGHR